MTQFMKRIIIRDNPEESGPIKSPRISRWIDQCNIPTNLSNKKKLNFYTIQLSKIAIWQANNGLNGDKSTSNKQRTKLKDKSKPK